MMRRKGYGLIEVLIALGLGALLLALLHRFLVPVLLASSQNSAQVHMSQQANLLIQKMEQDLKESDGSGLSYLEASAPNDPVALAICRRAGLSPEGVKLYQPNLRVYYYNPAEAEVRVRELELGEGPLPTSHDPALPLSLTDTELAAVTAANDDSKLLASTVTIFQPVDQWPVQGGVIVNFTLEQSVGGAGKKATHSVEKRISFR